MPHYEYQCEACKKTFELYLTLSDHEGKVKCPMCGSRKVEQLASTVSVVTSRKS